METDDKHQKRRREFHHGMRIVAITFFVFITFIAVWKRMNRTRQWKQHSLLPPSRFLRHREKHFYDITKRHDGDLLSKIHHLHAGDMKREKKKIESPGKLMFGVDALKKFNRKSNPE
jgi:hypothetical protein